MKISMSLPEEDVTFLDAYAEEKGLPSRSAALHKAVRLLRATGLVPRMKVRGPSGHARTNNFGRYCIRRFAVVRRGEIHVVNLEQ